MIEVKGLTKRFDNFTALEAASFTAEPGRVCGIVGPNGAGKTTLIKHLVGVYRPDEGSVLLDGAPIFENPAAKARIETMMDKVVEGFENLLDQLFQNDALDVTSDVQVLEQMLAKDGLSSGGLRLN